MKMGATFSCVVLPFVISVAVQAQDSPQNLDDAFLDKLIGDWNVERTMASGRREKNTVHAEWILHHQFVELDYRDAGIPSRYEARILIGYDRVGKRYICHWADSFGGDFSTDGVALRDPDSNAMEFKFTFHDGELTNRYAFDPQSRAWTSTIRQVEKGEWKLFCEDKFVRAVR